jgi:hypothetical protein
MSRLAPSHPFFEVGLGSIIPRGSISLLVTFVMPKNYCTESIIFDVMEFMVVAHYGYLVLKMSLPNGVIKVRGDCSTSISVLEKL